ncbi:MAG: hypothetical protein P8Z35_13275, partial [Ignavibacteriaceae bacterium]
SFWQKWLLITSIIISLFGIFIALFNQTILFNFLLNDKVNAAFFNSPYISSEVITFQKWIYGVLGATVFGWGIFLSFIAHYPFKRKEKWAWNCFFAGIISWFVVDTSISVYFNVIINAIFNTVLLIGIFIPLVFSRKYFAIKS